MRLTLLLIISGMSFVASCSGPMGHTEKGSGNIITESRPVEGFTGLVSHGSFEVHVSQSPNYSVKIEADDNLLPLVETEIREGILHVRTKEDYSYHATKNMVLYISAPQFDKLQSVGSGNVVSENILSNNSKIELTTAGSGDLRVQVNAPKVTTSIAGSGNIIVSGDTKEFTASIVGSGDIHGYDLKSENADLDIAGSGSVEISSSVRIKSLIAGSGDVKYKGEPQVSSSIVGSGTVKKIEL